MKKYTKQFCLRGLTWAWSGPVVMAIVWLCIHKAGSLDTLSVEEAVLGIFTTAVMAFLAAGVSIVNQIESLPKAFAGLIQGVVLYIDYLGFYLINGWISLDKIWLFTVIFVIGFVVIWLAIYIPIRIKVNRINKMLGQ